MPLTNTASDENEASSDNEKVEEWTLTKLFSIEELRSKDAVKCNSDECNLFSCVTYTSSFGTVWNTCLDCQDRDYGGWPPINEMPKECCSMTVSWY